MNTPSIQRATNRWQSFFSTLSQADITVLDRAATGHKLKVVRFEQDISYDTLQKRFKRWQFALVLSSLATLLHVWRVVRVRQIETDVDEPTLMRYAQDVSTESAQRVPEIDMPSELRHRHPAAMAVASAAERRQAMAGTLAQ